MAAARKELRSQKQTAAKQIFFGNSLAAECLRSGQADRQHTTARFDSGNYEKRAFALADLSA
jgi:hypothetical protein